MAGATGRLPEPPRVPGRRPRLEERCRRERRAG
jgi:hypothetical protein